MRPDKKIMTGIRENLETLLTLDSYKTKNNEPCLGTRHIGVH